MTLINIPQWLLVVFAFALVATIFITVLYFKYKNKKP